jgi:antitoxin FitA
MAQILVRNLDEATVKRLKARARSRNRSLQAEAKTILVEEAHKLTPEQAGQVSVSWHRRLKARRFGDSADLIRADRDRR